jgi:hypothetical protein
VATITRTADDSIKEPRGPLEATQARTPLSDGLSLPGVGQVVPPVPDKITPYGQDAKAPQDLLSTLAPFRTEAPGKYDAASAEVARLIQAGQPVSVPVYSKNEKYKGAEQSREQRTTLQKAAGQAARVYIAATMARPDYQAASDAQKAATLNKALQTAGEVTDIKLGEKVARTPESQAAIAFASTPHYAGIPSGLSTEEVRMRNYEISSAKALLGEYRKRFGDPDLALARLARDNREAAALAMTPRLPQAILDRKRDAIDKTFNGALSRAEKQGLLGAGNTLVPIGAASE